MRQFAVISHFAAKADIVLENYRAVLDWAPDLIEEIAKRCTEADTGARNIDNILSKTLLPELSSEFLAHMVQGNKINFAKVTLAKDGAFAYELG